MNKERLLKLADIIEKSPTFNMKNWQWGTYETMMEHPCGTPACIMGHAEVMRREELGITAKATRGCDFCDSTVREYLGLFGAQFQSLCYPSRDNGDAVSYEEDEISNAHAAGVIRELVRHGGPMDIPQW